MFRSSRIVALTGSSSRITTHSFGAESRDATMIERRLETAPQSRLGLLIETDA